MTKAELVQENEVLADRVQALLLQKEELERKLETSKNAIHYKHRLAIQLLKDTLGVD